MMTKKQHINKLRKQMKAIGTFRPEYEKTIEIAAQLLAEFEVLSERFETEGMPFEVETGSGVKKAPIVTTLEAMRRDILQYMSALGLTPSSLNKLDVKKPDKTDPFAAAIEKMMAGA